MPLIAIIPGDGIGPEVMLHATRMLEHYRDERGLPLVSARAMWAGRRR
jgi:isocitrate/isopropylmalate dehydrogenase